MYYFEIKILTEQKYAVVYIDDVCIEFYHFKCGLVVFFDNKASFLPENACIGFDIPKLIIINKASKICCFSKKFYHVNKDLCKLNCSAENAVVFTSLYRIARMIKRSNNKFNNLEEIALIRKESNLTGSYFVKSDIHPIRFAGIELLINVYSFEGKICYFNIMIDVLEIIVKPSKLIIRTKYIEFLFIKKNVSDAFWSLNGIFSIEKELFKEPSYLNVFLRYLTEQGKSLPELPISLIELLN